MTMKLLFLWLLSQKTKEATAWNIALNKPTYASSNFPDSSHPSWVVDGSRNGNYSQQSCMSTNHDDMNPWWLVDLLAEFLIKNITIKNRDDVLAERLHDFRVDVFKTNPVRCPEASGQECVQFIGGNFGSLDTLECTSEVTGRFLRIKKEVMIDEFDTLILCEVEVEGEETHRNDCGNKTMLPLRTGVKLEQSGASGFSTLSKLHCATECFKDSACLGVNYRETDGQCFLIREPSALDSRTSDSEFKYYGQDLC